MDLNPGFLGLLAVQFSKNGIINYRALLKKLKNISLKRIEISCKFQRILKVWKKERSLTLEIPDLHIVLSEVRSKIGQHFATHAGKGVLCSLTDWELFKSVLTPKPYFQNLQEFPWLPEVSLWVPILPFLCVSVQDILFFCVILFTFWHPSMS